MSKSSKTLKTHELPLLETAQRKATQLGRLDWVAWMHKEYPYSMAVKMAKHMGFTLPCVSFYLSMRDAGEVLQQSKVERQTSWGLMTDIDPLV